MRTPWTTRAAQELLSLVVTLVFLMPLVWMLLAAFKGRKAVYTGPLLPETWVWQNFVEAWNSAPFGQYLLNSLLIASLTTILVVITSALAAFAFARLNFPGKPVLFLFALGTLMIPGDALLIPNFITIREFGWINSYQALIAPFAASAFGVFLLRQAFLRTPAELEEAARLDGATALQYLCYVLLPVNGATVSALGVLTFLGSWNALVWPLVATNRDEFRTVQVGLASFSNLEGSNLPLVMAATVIVIAPVLIVYALAQKWFIESAAASGLKG
ncbi:carbohydrate ABC transporter permease [Deinococcus deserti]|uniref:Putative sugar ABC transporter, permease component n=1 Tax=Deinococcus deserti (strain DSM 17065 / CIP 109153 / LMG 22923 / VCD115) TaxID=546414 RepID=C1D3M9_DEIDV|nr:carbohydrate ABC transporter permease [Deinococcus deserti]ACO48108.1 putative sugar ABC transporter, permease component [Deinococcus deserti VCD115]